MINPIMNYGCEVRGFHKGQDIERLHLKFLKQVLEVNQHTTISMVYGELGRVPMFVIRKIRIVRYRFKIIKNPDLLISKIFNMRNTYGQHINGWALKVKNLLNELGFSYMFENQNINDIDVHIITRRIYDQYLQQWSTDIRGSPKADVYCLIKSDNNFRNRKIYYCC